MRLPRLLRAAFLRRDNRFLVTAALEGEVVRAHLADPGRLQELLTPGAGLWLAPATGLGRVTTHDVWLVEHGDVLVSINTRLPNALLEEALRAGWLFGGADVEIAREVTLGLGHAGAPRSRIDLLLTDPHGRRWVECKSVTLVEEGVALFPDAPTARGRRHVLELADAVERGDRAAVVFLVQRPDAHCVRPHAARDPAFAAALGEAATRGVALHALVCDVSHEEVVAVREVPVLLDAR